jgi:hypothetical protein
MKTINITRRTTLGYGYTSAVENDERGNLRVCQVENPTHIGTYNKVSELIQSDRTLNSYRGGTYYSAQWFVKQNGKWHKIDDGYGSKWYIHDLAEEKTIEIDILD